MPRFVWDARKAASNLRKHGVAFEDAERVWMDPLHIVRFDRFEHGEERWHALGVVAEVVLLLVVHAYAEDADEIRIIGARRATRAERRIYEEGDFPGAA